MIDLIKIDEKYKVKFNKDQNLKLKDKIYGAEKGDISQAVDHIEWIASMKPALGNIAASRSETVRYDEMDVFLLHINDVQELYAICRPVYKAIKYPCLLIIQIENRFLLSACSFTPGKLDYEENILKNMRFSHWIFPDKLSNQAKEFIGHINVILSGEGDIQELYKKLKSEIWSFQISGITKYDAQSLVKSLQGSESILKFCMPYKKYKHTGKGKHAKYTPKTTSFSYRFDTEDLWHALISNDKTSAIIAREGYQNIEHMRNAIENKLEWDKYK